MRFKDWYTSFFFGAATLFIVGCEKEKDKTPIELHVFDDIETFPLEKFTEGNEWNSTGWGVYEDIIFEGTSIQWSMDQINYQDEPVLKCDITGGDAYNNVFFTNTVAIRWEQLDWYFEDAQQFEYSLEFYPSSEINCDNADESLIEGLEFTFQHVKVPISWGWGLQWSKTNTWSYWDDQKSSDKVIGWKNIQNVKECLCWDKWNTIKIIGIQDGNDVIYKSIQINENKISVDIRLPSVTIPEDWAENFIQVGFQINGNKAILKTHQHGVDPSSVLLKNLDLNVYALQ